MGTMNIPGALRICKKVRGASQKNGIRVCPPRSHNQNQGINAVPTWFCLIDKVPQLSQRAHLQQFLYMSTYKPRHTP